MQAPLSHSNCSEGKYFWELCKDNMNTRHKNPIQIGKRWWQGAEELDPPPKQARMV